MKKILLGLLALPLIGGTALAGNESKCPYGQQFNEKEQLCECKPIIESTYIKNETKCVDVCLNFPGVQATVPEGYQVNSDHVCTVIPPTPPTPPVTPPVTPTTPQPVVVETPATVPGFTGK